MCIHKEGLRSRLHISTLVDDMLITAKKMTDVTELKHQLSTTVELKDLGAARRILGMDITRDRSSGVLKVSQSCYLK